MTDNNPGGAQRPGSQQRVLDVLIGKWINEGETLPTEGAPPVKILTSDVYEWDAGGFFVVHIAYGRIGDADVGGTEIIGHDPASDSYRSYFFDSTDQASTHELTVRDGLWTWTDGVSARCNATFSADGRVQTAHHESSPDGGRTWQPAMDVTLIKVV